MTELLLVTSPTLPDPDPDAAPLEAALRAAGIDARWVMWDDPDEDWRAPLTLIRSTWDYPHRADAFAAWTRAVDAAGRLCNPGALVRWNLHKGYLLEMAARGVATVPTVLVGRGEPVDVRAVCAERGWRRVVVKPAISCASYETHAFAADAVDDAVVARLNRAGDLLLQPYVESIHDRGERSLVIIEGRVTHAVRKSPRWSGGAERVDGPMPIEPAESALAERALALLDAPPLYGRLDLVHTADGRPMVAEFELIEPSLFFPLYPPACDALVRGLARRLGRV